jgi:AraC family transcriptional regulator, melibiose operon regulatory protein
MNYYLEQVQTDSGIPAKIYVNMAAEKRHYPLHFHDNLEFDLVLEGSITCVCNGTTRKISSGEFFFVNSGNLHETISDTNKRVKTVTVLLSYGLLKKYCPDIQQYSFLIPPDSDARRKIQQLLCSVGTLYLERNPFYELEITTTLELICLILLRECRTQKTDINTNPHDQKSLANIKAVLAYMEANYTENISLGMIASQVNMVPSYFSRFFKKITNETLYTYLMKLRAYHAYQELMNSDKLITDIALDSGFLNVKSFINSFKAVYGETPAKYRRLHESQAALLPHK